ncbi:glutathione S-transferase domain-containing protein [Phlyctema vagabunda]|uniref:Glutathione S-transferase domain-containing protein n=1 Tax=Phlyctema vagabunda TaxID=108571 RepID=A0ABR4PD34_9HELO
MAKTVPKITLYTNHRCPWAHRAHIALAELKLDFETVIIDLSTPRTPEYLAINPRGLVPTIKYNDQIITESAIVAQFLADAHPSHLLKTSNEDGGALQRARIAFFVDTFFSKALANQFAIIKATSKEEKEELGAKLTEVLVKEIEPLLADAAPFFGGSSRLTLAEVQTGSFVLRLLSFPKYEGLFPANLLKEWEQKTPNFWKWANAVVKEESVNGIWDEKAVAEGTLARFTSKV